jgi:hypothetical protein
MKCYARKKLMNLCRGLAFQVKNFISKRKGIDDTHVRYGTSKLKKKGVALGREKMLKDI